ncbi:MAG: pyruvate carboxyltransferase [Lachnospiraceae bacterium]|nr:pyruvate carboxyltransferase [Lachnospiraceae bacterium]
MMDYGKFEPELLPPRSERTIDGIRFAFHRKDREKILKLGRIIIDKGYDLFIQPMITPEYSDEELLELISDVNKYLEDAAGFYIVDSFGEMRPNDMKRMIHLIDHNLKASIPLGLHSHNNLQLSYSNAMAFIVFRMNREIIVDSSILGMGKGAGNLNTELLLEHINQYYGGKYNIAPLLEVIDSCINVLHEEYHWGYSPEFYLSSVNHCSPTYAKHLYSKHRLRIDQVGEVLAMLDDSKKISFDKSYVEEKYREYNSRNKCNDADFVSRLYSLVKDKEVLLIAPGLTVGANMKKLEEMAKSDNTITIALNGVYDLPIDFVVVTRPEMKGIQTNETVKKVLLSNICSKSEKEMNSKVEVLDYSKWITMDTVTRDSAGVVCLNLLKNSGAKIVKLAGFDGFSTDVNANYYSMSMRRALTDEEAENLNVFFSDFLKKIKKNLKIEFVTETLYEV